MAESGWTGDEYAEGTVDVNISVAAARRFIGRTNGPDDEMMMAEVCEDALRHYGIPFDPEGEK